MEIEIIRLKDELAKAQEKMTRISKAISFEYADFKTAEDAEMNLVLGENMRTQLKNVFDILEKEGVKLI